MHFVKLTLICLGLLLIQVTLFSQSDICNDTTYVTLDIEGQAFVPPTQFTLDTSKYDSLVLIQQHFDCSDLGFQEVNAKLYKRGGLIVDCQAPYLIKDDIAPEIVHDPYLFLFIEVGDTITVDESDFTIHYYDNCFIDSVHISKTRFDHSHNSSEPVVITILDQSGNATQIETTVRIEPVDCEETMFSCNRKISPNLFYGPVQITAEDLVSQRLKHCDFEYHLSWLNKNGQTIGIPNNTFTQFHVNQQFTAVLTLVDRNEVCSVAVHPIFCLPIHSSRIQWPEDVTISLDCPYGNMPDLNYLSPMIMAKDLQLDSIYYTIVTEGICVEEGMLFSNYTDHIIQNDSVSTILRHWQLLDWTSGQTFDHTQLIRIVPDSTVNFELHCPEEVTFHLGRYMFRKIDISNVLDDNTILICDTVDLSFLDKDYNPLDLPQNRVYRDYPDPYFYAVLTSRQGQEQCTTKVNIYYDLVRSCWERFWICDQLPRGQNFDDCNRNYTTEDNIEWPRDISVELCSDKIHDASPEYLLSQNGVPLKDAYPELLLEGCDPIYVQLNYNDSFPDSDTPTFPQRIIRSWQVQVHNDTGYAAFNTWTYNQLITVEEADTCDQVFQVRTASGLPIPDVTIGNGFVTGQMGTIDLDNYSLDSIIPEYTAPSMDTEITVKDLQLFNQGLEKKIYLNPLQRIAADVNFDGQVDADDLYQLYDYIFKDKPLQKEWVFVDLDSFHMQVEGHFQVPSYNEKTAFNSNENAYEYLGIKIGDLDQSAFKQKEEVGDSLTLLVENDQLTQGETVEVPVSIVENVPLISLQFSIRFDPEYLRFISIEGEANNINVSNYNLLNDSTLLFLWNEGNITAVGRGEKNQAELSPFMNLIFFVLKDGNLCNSIDLDTTELSEEAVYFNDQFETTVTTLQFECDGQVTSAPYPKTGDFSIYPNPAQDQIHIQWDQRSELAEYRYRILNSHGAVLFTKEAHRLNTIELPDIPAGLYWLEVLQDGQPFAVKKFIVQL